MILRFILSVLQFTDADGGVASEFVQKLQTLNAKNSEQELSIEKYLVKSEEAYFGKARKDKLSIAASIRSSQRDSIWGSTSPSLYSRPDCGSFLSLSLINVSPRLYLPAPTTNMHASSDSEGPLQQEANQPPPAPMTGLQIFMSREVFGWPIYTIVIAIGQVCGNICIVKKKRLTYLVDAECYKLPNYFADRSKLARQSSALCSWWGVFGCFSCMVSLVQIEAICLCSVSPLDFLWFGLLHDWHTIDRHSPSSSAYCTCKCCYLVLCCCFCCRFFVLWPEFWRGSCTCFKIITHICISYCNSRAQLLRRGFLELVLCKDPNRSGLLLCGIGVGL